MNLAINYNSHELVALCVLEQHDLMTAPRHLSPLLRRSRTYTKLSHMPVELVQKGQN